MTHLSAEELVAGLRDAGLRVTRPRRAICEALAAHHDDHLTAVDLQREAEARAGGSIDPSTIYRTIETLGRAGRLHHVHLGHGPAVIHLSDELDHHHLVCEECGRTEDVPLAEVVELLAGIEARYGFVADSVHFGLVGRCADHDRNRNNR